jgi:acyl-CoA thioesterase II
MEFLHLGDEAEPGQPARKRIWFRLTGELPDEPALHRYLLAYGSDFNLISTSLVPHGKPLSDPALQIASLDHALWFHHDVKVNDWLLYDMDSPGRAVRAASTAAVSMTAADAWWPPARRRA